MKLKDDRYDKHGRTMKNIICTIFLIKEKGKILHINDITKIVLKTPRYKVQKEPAANVRAILQQYDIFLKVNPGVKDGLYKLDESMF